jgi:hypothetical protein
MEKIKLPLNTLTLVLYSVLLVIIGLVIGGSFGVSNAADEKYDFIIDSKNGDTQFDQFWNKIAEDQKGAAEGLENMQVEVNTDADFFEVLNDAKEKIKSFENLSIKLCETETSDWELINLGIPNHIVRLKILIHHLELKHLEDCLTYNPSDELLQAKYEKAKVDFLDLIQANTLMD